VAQAKCQFVGGVIALCLAVPIVGAAQDDSPPIDTPVTEAPPSDGAAADESSDGGPDRSHLQSGSGRAEFDRVFAEWKYLLKDLRDIQYRFTISDNAQLNRIREQYLQKLGEGKVMVDQLRTASLKAYSEAPGDDPDLTQFLLRMASDGVAQDRYEQAWEICETLMQFDVPHTSLYDLAGRAAYATQNFDLAEQYLKQAASLGALQEGGDYLADLDTLGPLWEREQSLRAAEAEADDLPRVRLATNKGELILELFENEAPETVGNFVSLVEKGFYDGLVFHRVLPGFVAQTGCPLGDGTGGPGYYIYCEADRDDHRHHFRGTLSMAKSAERDTGGSQFFLAFRPIAHLNGMHTVFGRVIEGMEVLAELQRRDPDDPDQSGITPDRILTATVLRKRDHAYQPHPVE
jgi:cyclophilin family peptidyl-prolyl cis-trans isomerase